MMSSAKKLNLHYLLFEYKFHLEPDIPNVADSASTTNSIIINGSGITTPSSSNFDLFSVISVNPDSNPAFSRATTGSKNTSEDITVSGLTGGTEYKIEVVTEVGTDGTPCSNPSSHDSDPKEVTLCTRKYFLFIVKALAVSIDN